MAKAKTQFVCNQCGNTSSKWSGQCSACHEWNCIDEIKIQPASSGAKVNRYSNYSGDNAIQKLGKVSTAQQQRTSSHIKELDRVLGGGLVPGSVILLGGDPGIGKSTLLLQVSAQIAEVINPGLPPPEQGNYVISNASGRVSVAFDVATGLPWGY